MSSIRGSAAGRRCSSSEQALVLLAAAHVPRQCRSEHGVRGGQADNDQDPARTTSAVPRMSGTQVMSRLYGDRYKALRELVTRCGATDGVGLEPTVPYERTAAWQ